MLQAIIRKSKLWIFSKPLSERTLHKVISSRIRRCIYCSKFFVTPYGADICSLCTANEYIELTEQYIRKYRNMPYAEYLQTTHWHFKRSDALKRSKYRCQLCNSTKRLDVHHRTYENLGNEEPEDLIVLCRKCHEHFHIG